MVASLVVRILAESAHSLANGPMESKDLAVHHRCAQLRAETALAAASEKIQGSFDSVAASLREAATALRMTSS